jgi:hypothetical protein
MEAVPLAELSAEPFVHYDPDNRNAVWVGQFAPKRDVVLPQPTLRTGSPRTAAQLAAAGIGVAIVPFSALTPRPGGTIRSLDPPELRDVIVIVATPHDELLRRFVRDLMRCGLPESRVSQLGWHGSVSGPACYYTCDRCKCETHRLTGPTPRHTRGQQATPSVEATGAAGRRGYASGPSRRFPRPNQIGPVPRTSTAPSDEEPAPNQMIRTLQG